MILVTWGLPVPWGTMTSEFRESTNITKDVSADREPATMNITLLRFLRRAYMTFASCRGTFLHSVAWYVFFVSICDVIYYAGARVLGALRRPLRMVSTDAGWHEALNKDKYI